MRDTNFTIGICAALATITVWSGFIVAARAGVTSGLTPYDMAALRFMVTGAALAPFAWAWWPRRLPFHAQALIALAGPGVIYTLLVYGGLARASAAFGGVFANGSIPIFTMLMVLAFDRERPGRRQLFAVAIIIAGGVLLSLDGLMRGGADVLSGIALFLSASAVLSAYIAGFRRWGVSPKEALVVVNLPNALVYVPLWWFFLPSTMATAAPGTIAFQAFFQGFGPGILAVISIALTARHLGPTPTAGVAAAVPATAALMAAPLLNEIPSTKEWAGIGVATLGLFLLLIRR
ncbi:MAG: DMT family transporter [Pikeienuella sp.]